MFAEVIAAVARGSIASMIRNPMYANTMADAPEAPSPPQAAPFVEFFSASQAYCLEDFDDFVDYTNFHNGMRSRAGTLLKSICAHWPLPVLTELTEICGTAVCRR